MCRTFGFATRLDDTMKGVDVGIDVEKGWRCATKTFQLTPPLK